MDTKDSPTPVSRRRFLQTAAGAGGALFASILAACGSTPPPGTGGSAAGPTAAGEAAGGAAAGATPVATLSSQPPEPPTPAPREAASGRETVLEVWYPYGGDTSQQMEQYWKAYEAQNTKVGIKAVYAANDLSTNAKLFTAIASGSPPDVTWVDGPQVSEWAARGALEPLDDLINAAGIKPDDYWAPSWKQCVYNGKIWALTYGSDPNFGFFWNKDIFKEAGLDPEKPPQTIDEMDQMGDKVAKVSDGRIDRLGFIPWNVYGSANSMVTWGWDFGGEFFDPQNNKITANHPNNVKALEWMVAFAKKYDPTKISGFMSGFGSGEQHPFITGKIAMAPLGPWELPNIKKYAPNLKYGITFLPTGPGQTEHSSWVGGWTIGIPKGAKHRDAAFDFIKWISTSDEGTNIMGNTFNQFPGYKKSPYYEKVQQDPELKPFYEILVETKHQRPVMPAQAFYMGALQRAVDAAIFGQKTPQQALDDATAETQKELDRILKEGVQ
jgi:multiple sugar transport system substrate-binding protein